MKFFHLSDLHIGKQLHFYSLLKDQEAVLEEVVQYAQNIKPEAIVIAGDVYDKSVPSAEAVAVFDRFIQRLSDTGSEILVISGNHDSPERLEFASALLERAHLHIAGLPPVTEQDHLKRVRLTDEHGPVEFWLLPFLRPQYVRGVFPEEEIRSYTEAVEKILMREPREEDCRRVLVTHQFFTAGDKEPERSESEAVYVGGVGNVDVSAVKDFEYVAMGHIHKSQQVGEPSFRYCGALLKYAAGESGDEKGLTVVTLDEKGSAPEIEVLPLHPIRDVKVLRGTLKELLENGCEDYVSLTLTDEKMPYQPREKLLRVFPNMLELKVENRSAEQLLEKNEAFEMKDPAELFGEFYREIHGRAMDERERKLITDILTNLQEVEP